MYIGALLGKMGKEFACRDGSRLRYAAVLYVGHFRLDKFIVLLPERKLHNPLIHLVAHYPQQIQGILGILLHGGYSVCPYRPHGCPCQRRRIYYQRRVVFVHCIGYRVCQYQPSLRVGIDHLHRRPVIHPQHIVGGVGIEPRSAVCQRQEGNQMHRQLVGSGGKHHRRHRRGSCHVRLHLLHIVVRLYVQSARVVHHPFAYQRQRPVVNRLLRLVFQHHKTGLVHTPLVHSQQSAHTQRLYLLFVKYRAAYAAPFGRLPQLVGKSLGIKVHHGCVHPVAALFYALPQVHTPRQFLPTQKLLLYIHMLQMAGLLILVPVKTVVGKKQPLHKGRHLFRYHPFPCQRRLLLLLATQHPCHFVGTATQSLLTLRRRLLAVKIHYIQFVRQPVKHHYRIGIALAAHLQVFQFFLPQRQHPVCHLVAIQENHIALIFAGHYFFYIKPHICSFFLFCS